MEPHKQAHKLAAEPPVVDGPPYTTAGTDEAERIE